MAKHPTEMSLFLVLDVSDPLDVRPPVVEVNVGSNMAYNTKPGVAILVTVDAGNDALVFACEPRGDVKGPASATESVS